jgi:hypothetical protein
MNVKCIPIRVNSTILLNQVSHRRMSQILRGVKEGNLRPPRPESALISQRTQKYGKSNPSLFDRQRLHDQHRARLKRNSKLGRNYTKA